MKYFLTFAGVASGGYIFQLTQETPNYGDANHAAFFVGVGMLAAIFTNNSNK